MKKIDIFYATLRAKKFERLNDFYYYCIDCASDGIVLDIGSDDFLGLTKKLLDKQWVGEINAFDFKDLEVENNKIGFYRGDFSETIPSFLKNNDNKISILEIDLREPLPLASRFSDLKGSKVNDILTLCSDHFKDDVVIIVNEFMCYEYDNVHLDGYSLADFFEDNNKSYECLGYFPYNMGDDSELLGNEGTTAWVVSDSKSLQGSDLKNLINQLWAHSPCEKIKKG